MTPVAVVRSDDDAPRAEGHGWLKLDAGSMKPSYHVYVSELGNVFMAEIAAAVSAALVDLGYEVVFPAPGLPEAVAGRVNIVVAPHEFFPLQLNHSETELLRAAESSVALSVEQPGTPWFELGLHYASVSRHIIDISSFAVDDLSRQGYDVSHLQFGYHRSWDAWGGDPGRLRPTDLLFLGGCTPRREEALAAAANLVWEFKSDIRLFEFDRPMNVPRGNFVAGSEKRDLLASTRVLLNVHRNEVPYFEWIRVLEAVINGALVVTEMSSDYGPLIPGEHFLTAPVDLLAAQTLSILTDEPIRLELATAAYDFVRSNLLLESSLAPICESINDLGALPRRFRRPLPSPTVAPPQTSPSHPLLESALDVERSVRVRIKELLDSETDLMRKVEALQAKLVYRDSDHIDTFKTPAWSGFAPEATVVITCYNYADFVPEAIRSVAANTGIGAELIIVDDHSLDDSLRVVTDCMHELPWMPILLLARAANAGLGAARDLGVKHSRADRVFMLDADNAIFPTCLRKLSTALDSEPDAAFSYGIIARTGRPGLVSHLPWQIERLTKGNYIDAMAMLRKKVLEEVGGYDASLRGWEDYELWLRIADHGYSAVFLPDFIGTYRVHGASLLQTVNVDVSALLQDFKERYRFFPWDES